MIISFKKNNHILKIVKDPIKHYGMSETILKSKVDVCCPENVQECCNKLDCTKEQLFYCIGRVGKELQTIETYWSMNKDILKIQLAG